MKGGGKLIGTINTGGGGGWGGGGGKGGFGGGGKGGCGGGGKGGAKSKTARKIQEGARVYTGKVKCVFSSKNIGIIESDAIAEEHKSDVFAWAPDLAAAKCGVGDEVAFLLHWSPKGQVCANPVIRIKNGDENWYAQKGSFRATPNEFGFIHSEAMKEWFGKDVYVHRNVLYDADLEDRAPVVFNCYLNQDGQPNCHSVCVCEPDFEPAFKMPADPKVVMEQEKATGEKIQREPGATGRAMIGTIEQFNEEMDFARIRCSEIKEEFGQDVFCSGKELGEHKVGSQVGFELFISKRQKPQAVNLMDASKLTAVENMTKEDFEEGAAPAGGPLGGPPPGLIPDGPGGGGNMPAMSMGGGGGLPPMTMGGGGGGGGGDWDGGGGMW